MDVTARIMTIVRVVADDRRLCRASGLPRVTSHLARSPWSADALTKVYGTTTAVDGLTLQVVPEG